MLDSLYEKALKKKDLINEKLNDIGEFNIDPSKQWVNFPMEDSSFEVTLAAGDGSINKHKFLPFIFYAIDAECLIHNKDGLKRVESSEIDIIHHHRYVKDRLRNYMGIFEIKNALKAFEDFNVDLLLFDGSILGNLIRPFPLENELQNEVKERIKNKYLMTLEKELKHSDVEITSSKFSEAIEEDFKDKTEFMVYLENLENLLVISKFLKKRKIVAISKTSTSNEYFSSKIPDMAIFDGYSRKQGYSKPKYFNVLDFKRDYFPVCNEFFRSLTFTIFYARLEDHKNILKFELPYEVKEEDVVEILKIIKAKSTEGYPLLLKMAHNDVIIRKGDLERLSRIIGFLEKTGREML
jgi:NurA-like 5'-3' nuclease